MEEKLWKIICKVKPFLGTPMLFTFIVVLADLLISLAMTLLYSYFVPQAHILPPRPGHGMTISQTYLFVRIFVGTFNIILLVALFFTYVKAYLKLKDNFTLGLSLFILVMLIQEIMAYPLVHISFGFSGLALGPFYIIPKILESVALVIFFYLSTE
ncbi:MAG: hypothetical protein ACP6IS_07620 [Candidatus Asgardarchaeia archaeon]